MTTVSAFLRKKLSDDQSRLKKRLDAYLEASDSDESVHDVRTSIRRLEVLFSMLPKKVRRRNRNKIEKYRKFFRANSKVRDLDVIRSRLAALSPDTTILDELQKKRKSELAHAAKSAKAMKKVQPIRLDSMPNKKYETRIDKVTKRLSSRIRRTLPVVLSDSGNLQELHALRKDCKKLRYVLEALPADVAKKYENKVSSAIDKQAQGSMLLEKLQDIIGEVRDSDITIQYLKDVRSKTAGDLIAKESANRRRLYEEFATYAKNQVSEL